MQTTPDCPDEQAAPRAPLNSHLHPIFREALAPFAPLDVDNIKVGHALRHSSNDGELSEADVDDEVHRLEADVLYNQQKNSGELERRRIESAPQSFHERQMRRDLP